MVNMTKSIMLGAHHVVGAHQVVSRVKLHCWSSNQDLIAQVLERGIEVVWDTISKYRFHSSLSPKAHVFFLICECVFV